jgi:hypothetical protein
LRGNGAAGCVRDNESDTVQSIVMEVEISHACE